MLLNLLKLKASLQNVSKLNSNQFKTIMYLLHCLLPCLGQDVVLEEEKDRRTRDEPVLTLSHRSWEVRREGGGAARRE